MSRFPSIIIRSGPESSEATITLGKDGQPILSALFSILPRCIDLTGKPIHTQLIAMGRPGWLVPAVADTSLRDIFDEILGEKGEKYFPVILRSAHNNDYRMNPGNIVEIYTPENQSADSGILGLSISGMTVDNNVMRLLEQKTSGIVRVASPVLPIRGEFIVTNLYPSSKAYTG